MNNFISKVINVGRSIVSGCCFLVSKGKSLITQTKKAMSTVVVLVAGVSSADAAVDASVTTALTAATTDIGLYAAEFFPVMLTILAAGLAFKLTKIFWGKAFGGK